MPLPIICAYECFQQYLMSYRDLFSKPQYKYFVIVLLGFIQCQQARTLCGLQRCVSPGGSLSGLSRFFALAPWESEALVERWQERFRTQMMPVVQAELKQQQDVQLKRRGRPKAPVVTGYLIGDDSTMRQPRKVARWKALASTTPPLTRDAYADIAWSKDSMCSRDGAAQPRRVYIGSNLFANENRSLSRAKST
jgi:hypothetical protein